MEQSIRIYSKFLSARIINICKIRYFLFLLFLSCLLQLFPYSLYAQDQTSYSTSSATLRIQGETEWRHNLYAKGVTTTSAVEPIASNIRIEVDTTAVGGSVRDLFGVNKSARALQKMGSTDMYNVASLYKQFGVSHVRAHDNGIDLCGTYKDATLYDMTTAIPTVLSGTCTTEGVGAPPQLKWNVNNAADVDKPENYDFTEVDKTIANIVETGADLYLRLGQTYNGPSNTDDPAAWAKVAINIYKHIIGQFKPSGVSLNPVAVEVYNEPDGGFWRGSKGAFMTYYNNTVDGVRSAATAAGKSPRIGGAGFTNELVSHIEISQNVASTFIETATPDRLDFLSAHHYNDCSNATLAKGVDWFDSVRAALAAKGYPQSKPLDITEFNIGLGIACGNAFYGEAQVQSFVSGMLTLIQQVDEWNVEHAMFYAGFPNMALITNSVTGGSVVVNPSAWALWAHSQLKGGILLSTESCVSGSACVSGKSAASSPVIAVAAKMSTGGYRIVVTNTTSEAQTYTLSLKGLSTALANIQVRTPVTTTQNVATASNGSEYVPTATAITGLMATISTTDLNLPVSSGVALSSSITLPAWSLNVIEVALSASSINGACGSSNGTTVTVPPTTGLCSPDASVTLATTSTGWSWSCAGTNGGTPASCTANQTTTATNIPMTLKVGWNLMGWTTTQGYYQGTAPLSTEQASSATMSSNTMATVFTTMGLSSTDSYVVVGPDGVVYMPGSPFNTLKKALPGKAYWIYTPSDKTITVPGSALLLTDQLSLNSGWTQIAYWGTDGVAPATGFNCINSLYDILVDESGKVYMAGSPFNTLKTLQKNKGYFIHTTAPATLVYQCN
jgi:hypothetical protein